MTKTTRSLALAVAASFLLSACGLLNTLIPDQTIEDGVLGIGAAGIQIPLDAEPGAAGIGVAQLTATVFSGTFDVDAVPVDAVEGLPAFVDAAAITETIALGDSVEVTYPTTGPAESFTLVELEIAGTVTISSVVYPLPTLVEDGLSVVFSNPDCTAGVCTYDTASGLPEFDVALVAAAVAAYSALLQDGGTIAADVTVTATLDAPGLAADATIVITLESLGAVIEF
jgi:hypothetical protein